jgi:hypothetical protein
LNCVVAMKRGTHSKVFLTSTLLLATACGGAMGEDHDSSEDPLVQRPDLGSIEPVLAPRPPVLAQPLPTRRPDLPVELADGEIVVQGLNNFGTSAAKNLPVSEVPGAPLPSPDTIAGP